MNDFVDLNLAIQMTGQELFKKSIRSIKILSLKGFGCFIILGPQNLKSKGLIFR